MYEREIALIKHDLGIEDLPVVVRLRDVAWVTTNPRDPEAYGIHFYDRAFNKHWISIAIRHPYAVVLDTIAHEFRHAKQFHQGWVRLAGDTYTWTGTLYVPSFDSYTARNRKYKNRPHEIDARAYAAEAVKRLFPDAKQRERMTTKQSTRNLFNRAMFDDD